MGWLPVGVPRRLTLSHLRALGVVASISSCLKEIISGHACCPPRALLCPRAANLIRDETKCWSPSPPALKISGPQNYQDSSVLVIKFIDLSLRN